MLVKNKEHEAPLHVSDKKWSKPTKPYALRSQVTASVLGAVLHCALLKTSRCEQSFILLETYFQAFHDHSPQTHSYPAGKLDHSSSLTASTSTLGLMSL